MAGDAERDAGSERGGSDTDEASDSASMESLLRAVAFSPRLTPPGGEDPRVGETLGRFRITGLLGRGGMGVVYAAVDSALKRPVALKLLPREAAPDEERRRRFLREARSAAAVSHPNIAAVFEVGEAGGEVFIAMERVDGRTLRAAMSAAGGPLDEAEAARLAQGIARGLAAAHAAGVIHRDVKPENVMITAGGDVKLLDFGLAKLRAEAGDASASASTDLTTREGRLLGTPSYMSPEQARGLPADARSDVFALGVVLHEMLAGERPFQGKTTADVLAAILRDAPPRIPPRGRASAALADVAARCLEKDPGARYGHAGEVLAALGFGAEGAVRRPGAPHVELDAAAAAPAEPGALLPRRTTPARARRRLWPWLVFPAIAAALAAASPALRAPADAPAEAAPGAAAPAPRPTAITDLPLPPSSSPDAIATYKAAMQSFRDANWGRAELSLRDALKHDPALAAAHLRLALIMSNLDYVTPEAQAAYREATRLRSALTQRDRGLLAALEPLLAADPVDVAEAARRLDALSKTYPHDAELFNLIAIYQRLGPPALRLAAGRRAVEIDPEYADAWQQVGGALVDSDPAEAAVALDHCTTITPTAADCWGDRATLESALGRCAEAEAFLRRATGDPRSSSYYRQMRAHLLYALGSPREAVAEMLRQKWARLDPASREEEEIHDSALLAAAYGDFEEAKARAEEGTRQADAQPTLRAHARFARLLVDIELEAGRDAAAAAVASGFSKRRQAWQLGLPTEDPAVYFARVAARGGDVSAERDAWYRAAAPTTAVQRAEVWALAYVLGAEREDEAAEALAARPADARWSILNGPVDAALARALWLGGRRDEAMVHLARTFTRCDRFPMIFVSTRTSLLYGRALEERGDRGRACEVYAALVARWGGATPRSVTAEAARRRAAALGCAAAPR